MRDTHTRLFVHFVWGTWDRLPLITAEVEQAIYADIRIECEKMRAELLEVNGTEDHIHVLAQIPATVAIADLVKQMKGSSSHLVTHRLPNGGSFKWQGSYAAFTVSEYEVHKVRNYVRGQKEHHRDRNLISRYELTVASDEHPGGPEHGG